MFGKSKIKKPVTLDKQEITDFLSTRSRSRTGTVSHRCLRPARLPIPPSGLQQTEITTVISRNKEIFSGSQTSFSFNTVQM